MIGWVEDEGDEVSDDDEGDKVFRWDSIVKKWVYMGLKNAESIVAGPEGHIYATALPYIDEDGLTLYRWSGGKQWKVVPGPSGIGI